MGFGGLCLAGIVSIRPIRQRYWLIFKAGHHVGLAHLPSRKTLMIAWNATTPRWTELPFSRCRPVPDHHLGSDYPQCRLPIHQHAVYPAYSDCPSWRSINAGHYPWSIPRIHRRSACQNQNNARIRVEGDSREPPVHNRQCGWGGPDGTDCERRGGLDGKAVSGRARGQEIKMLDRGPVR